MAILSDSDILERISGGSLVIEGFDEGNLTPNGYDVTVEQVLIPATGERCSSGSVMIQPGTRLVIGTKEVLSMPSDLVGQIWIRTTWARRGILSSFGIIDAGFRGNLTFSAVNVSDEPVVVRVGDRFAQVVFIETSSPSQRDYGKRSGNYQGQRGITLSPRKRRSVARPTGSAGRRRRSSGPGSSS